jgi:hypothetical protein
MDSNFWIHGSLGLSYFDKRKCRQNDIVQERVTQAVPERKLGINAGFDQRTGVEHEPAVAHSRRDVVLA